jgi:hypothetical protein
MGLRTLRVRRMNRASSVPLPSRPNPHAAPKAWLATRDAVPRGLKVTSKDEGQTMRGRRRRERWFAAPSLRPTYVRQALQLRSGGANLRRPLRRYLLLASYPVMAYESVPRETSAG